jgi:thiamine-phosphate pyrophosphorylase
MQESLYRIIDANYNRAREGLRVCEDIFRFLLWDQDKAVKIKKVRRALARIIGEFPAQKLLSARDVDKDRVKFRLSKSEKLDVKELLRRNFQRVTEALRVLEEITVLFDPGYKNKLMRLRFKVYGLEKFSLGGK